MILKLWLFSSLVGSSSSVETESETDSSFIILNRRSSSGGLLSPEVCVYCVFKTYFEVHLHIVLQVELSGTSSKPLGEASENDGFYMLKKDSQRRTTLSKVLSQDEAKICDVWMDKIENTNKVQVVITKVNEIKLQHLRCNSELTKIEGFPNISVFSIEIQLTYQLKTEGIKPQYLRQFVKDKSRFFHGYPQNSDFPVLQKHLNCIYSIQQFVF